MDRQFLGYTFYFLSKSFLLFILKYYHVRRYFDIAVCDITISRYSSGVLYRLGFPVAILLILVAVTFWSDYESRIGDTITILLSVSALYIVIFGNIPLVGYLTSFDTYMISMYIFVACCVLLHQVTRRMHQKHDSWPLRAVYVRILEVMGRMFVLPIVCFSYYFMFQSSFGDSHVQYSFLVALVTIFCVLGGIFSFYS